MSAHTNRLNDDATLIPIGKVVEEVGKSFPSVTQSSLRFLEREGLIVPTRTPGGHRLYSAADVQRIVQIKEWQEQRLSLDQIRERLEQRDRLPNPSALTQRFLEEVLQGDVEAARRNVLSADEVGMPIWQTFSQIIEPALIEVGNGWERGTILVAQEKTVSEVVRDLIAELAHRHTTGETHGPAIVAACVAGERHELGLRMIVALLRASGRRVHYLGADVDTQFLVQAIRLRRPAAVLLSARLDTHMQAVEAAVSAIQAEFDGGDRPLVVVGGQLAARRPDELRALGTVPIPSASATDAERRVNVILESLVTPNPDERDF